MLIKDVKYYGEDFRFHYGDIETKAGCFKRITEHDKPAHCRGLVLPGLIDIHVHGNSGVDFCDGDHDSLISISRFLAKAGTTSFSATSMTLPEGALEKACRSAVRLREEKPEGCASIRGITMEGPFFSEKRKGAQSAQHLRLPDFEMFLRLQQAAGGMIRIACVAPEIEGAEEYIRKVSDTGVVAAAAHTDANYNEAAAGFDAGITHLTHLYNAMPPMLHREPGIIGAAAEREGVTAELICDGVHVHPSAVRAAFKLFGPERICLISDAIAATGIKGGKCTLGGQSVFMKSGRAVLEDGTLAGSTVTLLECLRNAISMGIPAEDAVRCATANPARVLGDGEAGVISEGKRADFLICGEDLELKQVFIEGNMLGGDIN